MQVFGIVSQCRPFFRGLYSPGVSLGVPRSLLLEPDGFRYLGSAGVKLPSLSWASGMFGPLSACVSRGGTTGAEPLCSSAHSRIQHAPRPQPGVPGPAGDLLHLGVDGGRGSPRVRLL